MSELKRCPFCGMKVMIIRNRGGVLPFAIECGRLECNAMTKYFPTEEEAIKAWNTRKPMERIVERLEEELHLSDKEKERCVKENPLQFDEVKGYARGIANAIEIVKEEGDLNV